MAPPNVHTRLEMPRIGAKHIKPIAANKGRKYATKICDEKAELVIETSNVSLVRNKEITGRDLERNLLDEITSDEMDYAMSGGLCDGKGDDMVDGKEVEKDTEKENGKCGEDSGFNTDLNERRGNTGQLRQEMLLLEAEGLKSADNTAEWGDSFVGAKQEGTLRLLSQNCSGLQGYRRTIC
jgi:hypothetical protein